MPALYTMPNLQKERREFWLTPRWSELWETSGDERRVLISASGRGDPRYLIFELIIYYRRCCLNTWLGMEGSV